MKHQTTKPSQKTAIFKEVVHVSKEAIDTKIMEPHASLAIINEYCCSSIIKYLNLKDI